MTDDAQKYAGEIREIPVDQIEASPYQPRDECEKEALDSLAASITSVGLIHPPMVRPYGEDRYQLIAGERRFRACCLLGMKKIPVMIRDACHLASAEAALVENIQRVDLNPMEVARALKKLMLQFEFKQEELAKRVGKKRSTVANYLRLLTLPENIQESVETNVISMGHAKAILSLDHVEDRHSLHEQIVSENMTVRAAEDWVNKSQEKPKPKKKKTAYRPDLFFIQDLEDRLQQHLGSAVKVQAQGNKGKLVIDYHDLDDLDRILEVIGLAACL